MKKKKGKDRKLVELHLSEKFCFYEICNCIYLKAMVRKRKINICINYLFVYLLYTRKAISSSDE